MPTRPLRLAATALLFCAHPVHADAEVRTQSFAALIPPAPVVHAQPAAPVRADQLIYKGVIGNLLEGVPMDAERRVELQRANTVVSSPFSARSLALLLGVSSPVFLIGGIIWGLWAASQIEAPTATGATGRVEPPARGAVEAPVGIAAHLPSAMEQ
jgi:hypothetical protein